MQNTYFMHRIKHDASKEGSAAWDKGIEVHETQESAVGSFHAYMGVWGYGRASQGNVDYVCCTVTDINSGRNIAEAEWIRPDPEPEPEIEE